MTGVRPFPEFFLAAAADLAFMDSLSTCRTRPALFDRVTLPAIRHIHGILRDAGFSLLILRDGTPDARLFIGEAGAQGSYLRFDSLIPFKGHHDARLAKLSGDAHELLRCQHGLSAARPDAHQ